MTKQILQEVQAITADIVAQKNDAAKLNFPKIIEKIKAQASMGYSSCILSLIEMNEYDKKLLEEEGFRVSLQDKPKDYFSEARYQKEFPSKQWMINW